MNVKIVKLTSGEELFGEFDEETNVIKNPVVMIPVSKEKIAFQPWLPYSEDKDYKFRLSLQLLIQLPMSIIGYMGQELLFLMTQEGYCRKVFPCNVNPFLI